MFESFLYLILPFNRSAGRQVDGIVVQVIGMVLILSPGCLEAPHPPQPPPHQIGVGGLIIMEIGSGKLGKDGQITQMVMNGDTTLMATGAAMGHGGQRAANLINQDQREARDLKKRVISTRTNRKVPEKAEVLRVAQEEAVSQEEAGDPASGVMSHLRREKTG